MEEQWKDIPSYEGYYQASNLGKIRSFHNDKNGRLLKQAKVKRGHAKNYFVYCVALYKNGIGKTYNVHKLVALAFILNPNNKPHINHIDSNPLNNCVWNLEWCTPLENSQHSIKYGFRKPKYDLYSIIDDYLAGLSMKQVGIKNNVCSSHVWNILNKNNIKTRGVNGK